MTRERLCVYQAKNTLQRGGIQIITAVPQAKNISHGLAIQTGNIIRHIVTRFQLLRHCHFLEEVFFFSLKNGTAQRATASSRRLVM